MAEVAQLDEGNPKDKVHGGPRRPPRGRSCPGSSLFAAGWVVKRVVRRGAFKTRPPLTWDSGLLASLVIFTTCRIAEARGTNGQDMTRPKAVAHAPCATDDTRTHGPHEPCTEVCPDSRCGSECQRCPLHASTDAQHEPGLHNVWTSASTTLVPVKAKRWFQQHLWFACTGAIGAAAHAISATHVYART